ncbi:hypothetical protein OU798_16395 [Prolixibacteraceae bacterium Z1-6]|uniref:DUF4136 domain-containing protein n=1 Tax=Draconibacterium aestuarii TaxID=2998507 RepID=A0A9X3J8P6_9BACT|nr:hypothetical protein [Prolixibacteraceae bacterium Z1-6]
MKKLFIIFSLSSILLFGCTPSTQLINSWSDKENTPQEYKNIGVAVLFPNSSNRYITERSIVDELKENGIQAMPTYDVFPMAGKLNELIKDPENPEKAKEFIIKKVTENNIDALMVVTLFNQITEERWVKDRNFNFGGTGYYGTELEGGGSYYDYYSYSLGTIHDNGYFTDKSTYFIECNLYDVASEKLLYRTQTKSANVKSIDEESKKLANIIVKELAKNKVVQK